MKKVGIITYAETSGLYYLADRLSKGLLAGKEVVFFPKIRLRKVNGFYKKDVSIKVNDSRFIEVIRR